MSTDAAGPLGVYYQCFFGANAHLGLTEDDSFAVEDDKGRSWICHPIKKEVASSSLVGSTSKAKTLSCVGNMTGLWLDPDASHSYPMLQPGNPFFNRRIPAFVILVSSTNKNSSRVNFKRMSIASSSIIVSFRYNL